MTNTSRVGKKKRQSFEVVTLTQRQYKKTNKIAICHKNVNTLKCHKDEKPIWEK